MTARDPWWVELGQIDPVAGLATLELVVERCESLAAESNREGKPGAAAGWLQAAQWARRDVHAFVERFA